MAEKLTGGEAECSAKVDGTVIETIKIPVNKTASFSKVPDLDLWINNYEGELNVHPDTKAGVEADAIFLTQEKGFTTTINKRVSVACKILSPAMSVTRKIKVPASNDRISQNPPVLQPTITPIESSRVAVGQR
jgi:hypothetical protein